MQDPHALGAGIQWELCSRSGISTTALSGLFLLPCFTGHFTAPMCSVLRRTRNTAAMAVSIACLFLDRRSPAWRSCWRRAKRRPPLLFSPGLRLEVFLSFSSPSLLVSSPSPSLFFSVSSRLPSFHHPIHDRVVLGYSLFFPPRTPSIIHAYVYLPTPDKR